MATENVKTFEVKINGIESVKDLKKHISDLRDKLVQLDDTSEDYSEVVDELVESQKKLNSVMGASSKNIKSAEGSYNALVAEMRALKTTWREVTSEAERAKIGERINEINDELKRMDGTIGNHQRKVGSYEEAFTKAFKTPQQELRALRVQLAQLEEGTDEYRATFAKMAQLTHDVTEQQEMLRWSSADLGDILGNVVGVAQGVAGGLSAISAVSGLISDGNEDVEEAMLTTQRWLQLIQGLGALEELGDRIKGLWQGLKNYAQSQNTAVASMGDFADKAEAVEGTATQVSQSINTQSTSMKQATNATNELAEATNKLTEAQIGQIAISGDKISHYKKRLEIYEQSNRALEEENKQQSFRYESNQKQISILQTLIKEEEDKISAINQDTSAIKQNTNVTKTLGTSTSWLGKQLDLLNVKFKTMSASSNVFVAGMGKAGTAVMALGTTIKAALVSTGIGLLIVALGTAVSWLWKFVDGSAKAEERTNALKESTDKLNESLEIQDKAWERQEKIMQAQGASYEELYEAEKKHLQTKLAEVRASLAVAQATAKDIGQRKLQKAKYDEFRQTLEDLIEKEKELKIALEDLDVDKEVNAIKEKNEETKRLAEEEKRRAEEQKRQYEERMRQLESERKKAKELYDELKDSYRSELSILKETYKEKFDLLGKMKASEEEIYKARVLLMREYHIKKEEIELKGASEVWARARENNKKQMELYADDSQELYEAQLKVAENFRDNLNYTLTNWSDDDKKNDQSLAYLNIFEGLDIRTLEELKTEFGLAEKAVNEAKNALLEFHSTKIMDKIGSDFQKLSFETQQAMTEFELSVEKSATEGSRLIKGFYTGIAPSELRSQMEQRFAIQEEFLNRELEMYKKAINEKNLTDQDRAILLQNIRAIEFEQQNLLTQKMIESNYLTIENYENMASSIQGIAGSIGDILGNVADLIMGNAEAQLEAGEITEEEYNRQFEKAKALQIATAIINTIAGAVGAFTGITRDTGGWGIALAIAQATAVFTAGMLQVQQIKNTKPNSSGSNSSSARYAEVTANPTADYTPQLTQNTTGETETENLSNANIVVSVVDIDNAQAKNRVRVSESSF